MRIAGVTPEFHGACTLNSVTPIPLTARARLSRKLRYCNSFGTKLLQIPSWLAFQLRLQDFSWKQDHLGPLR